MKDDKEYGLINLLVSWIDIIFKVFEKSYLSI